MKANYLFLLASISILLVASCAKKDSEPAKKVLNFSDTQKSVLSASNQFGLALFKELAVALPQDSNLFISPLSVSLALTMTYNGAANETATDMQTTLGYGTMSKPEINQACKDLVQMLLNSDSKVIMEIANSIWYRNTFVVKDSFLSINQTYFNAEVKAADFDNVQTVTLINNWVSEKTQGKIDKIITEISPDMVMYLINAVYFKGTWQYEFDKSKTASADFSLSGGGSYSTDFMVQKSKFRYYENETFTSIDLPYGNGNFSMIVMLPKTGNTCQSILDNLTVANWSLWNTAQSDSAMVQVYLPKFKFQYDQNLGKVLSSLGMAVAFDSNNADFSGIDGAKDLFISEVRHKTYVEVNEEGTEAAAVTSVGVGATYIGSDEPIYFRANKPFIFAIKENSTNSILFIGLMQKPVVQQ